MHRAACCQDRASRRCSCSLRSFWSLSCLLEAVVGIMVFDWQEVDMEPKLKSTKVKTKLDAAQK